MNDEVIQMRPFRALLSVISSVVFCMFVWTSDVHALTMTVSDGTNTPVVLTFSQIAPTTHAANNPVGCLSGYSCWKPDAWITTGPTPTEILSFQTGIEGPTWLTIDNGAAFTSGPIVSVRDISTSAVFGINGGIFQGFSTTTGTLFITLEHTFTALTTSNTRPFGMIESGQFLQPGTGGNVTGDTITMRGAVDGTNFAQIVDSANGTNVDGFSLSLSPTIPVPTTFAGGTNISYTWTYAYNNTGITGAITDINGSRFSDPAGGIGNCSISSQNPGCVGGTGGSAVGVFANDGEYNQLRGTICGTGGCDQTPNTLPEPSSFLLLGMALAIGGVFVAARLRKSKDMGDGLEGA
jgi:hypothetical protein